MQGNIVELPWLEYCRLVTMAVSNSFLSPLEKSHSCTFGIFKGDLCVISKMVYCVYSLESPR